MVWNKCFPEGMECRPHFFLALVVLPSVFFICGCSSYYSSANNSEGKVELIDRSLQHYAGFILHMENDSIADMFAEDGEIVNPRQEPLRGRENIRKFLKSFTEYRVLIEKLVADSTNILRRKAIQIGDFYQKVIISNGKTVEVSGRFKIEWVNEDGKWLIKRVATFARH